MNIKKMIKGTGTVKLNLDIYKTIIASTTRYANARIPESEWAEVYGLLYGYIDKKNVIITEAIPFTHTKKQRHILKVEFEEEDYALAASIESETYMRNPPQYIVGWYHSHPGIKLMLSQDDIKNQLAWQTNNPFAIALVFDHVRLLKQVEFPSKKGDPIIQLKNDLGFLIFRLDDPNRGIEAAFHEVNFEFTDFQVDKSFVDNAQEFVQWVTKSFPKGENVISEYTKYVKNLLKKLSDIYDGTTRYIETLKRKGEGSRIQSVVESQALEATKILDSGNTMIDLFRMMKNNLEYKEREIMTPQIDEILAEWDNTTKNYIEKFRN